MNGRGAAWVDSGIIEIRLERNDERLSFVSGHPETAPDAPSRRLIDEVGIWSAQRTWLDVRRWRDGLRLF